MHKDCPVLVAQATKTNVSLCKQTNPRPVHFENILGNEYEPVHEISNNVACATSKASDQPAQTHSLVRAFAGRLSILWLFSY